METDKWRNSISSLSEEEKNIIMPIIFKNNFSNIDEMDVSDRIKHVLSFYKNYRAEIADPNSELFTFCHHILHQVRVPY